MEPGEKFIRRVLTFVRMIFAFVISIVFGEYYHGLTSFGFLLRMTSISKRIGRASQENGPLTMHKATLPEIKVIMGHADHSIARDGCFE